MSRYAALRHEGDEEKQSLCPPRPQGQLQSANVGDSGFLVLGRAPYSAHYGVKYHSPQQEHSFGCPYQLGHYEGADAPEDAMLMTLPVRGALGQEIGFWVWDLVIFPSSTPAHIVPSHNRASNGCRGCGDIALQTLILPHLCLSPLVGSCAHGLGFIMLIACHKRSFGVEVM